MGLGSVVFCAGSEGECEARLEASSAEVAVFGDSAGGQEMDHAGEELKNWSEALNYFTVLWPERMSKLGRLA